MVNRKLTFFLLDGVDHVALMDMLHVLQRYIVQLLKFGRRGREQPYPRSLAHVLSSCTLAPTTTQQLFRQSSISLDGVGCPLFVQGRQKKLTVVFVFLGYG